MVEQIKPEDGNISVWTSFAGDTMPSYIVQSFLSDCALYPKILLHKDFHFFREYLESIGMTFTFSNDVYVKNHEQRFFCVELEKKLLKEILSREDYLPEEGAWATITRLDVRKKLGLGIWKWEIARGVIEILELFILYCRLNLHSFKQNTEMEYFQKFMSDFSLERGFETEEIYVYERADEIRKARCGYVSPITSSDEADDTGEDCDDEESSVSSIDDLDFDPKKRYSGLRTSSGRGKVKKQLKRNLPVTQRKGKQKSSNKPKLTVIKCPKCGERYKYRTALNKHLRKVHSDRHKSDSPSSTKASCARKLTFVDNDDDDDPCVESDGDSDSSCQIIYSNFDKDNPNGKRFSTLRTLEGRASVRHQLKEIVNDLNIRKGTSKDKNSVSIKKGRSSLIKCSRCPATYQYLKSLRKHIRNIHGDKSNKSSKYR